MRVGGRACKHEPAWAIRIQCTSTSWAAGTAAARFSTFWWAPAPRSKAWASSPPVFKHYETGGHCACGALVRECPFWDEVRRRFEAQGFDWIAFCRASRRQTSVGRWLGTRLARADHPGRRQLATQTQAFARAVAETSGKPHLLDSNKETARGLFLLRYLPEARVIHLVRDPRGVLRSHYWRVAEGRDFRFMNRLHRPGAMGPRLARSRSAVLDGRQPAVRGCKARRARECSNSATRTCERILRAHCAGSRPPSACRSRTWWRRSRPTRHSPSAIMWAGIISGTRVRCASILGPRRNARRCPAGPRRSPSSCAGRSCAVTATPRARTGPASSGAAWRPGPGG